MCPCCGGATHVVGESVSERLGVIPAWFYVSVTRRPKYACRHCVGGSAVQAPDPGLLEGAMPTESMLAHVLVSKYNDHLPLYRQAKIYARQGINLDRSTLADWTGRTGFHLRPLRDAMLADMLRSGKLFMDETGIPVLAPGTGKTQNGWLWATVRDDGPWCGPAPPAVVYTYAPGRGGKYAAEILGDYIFDYRRRMRRDMNWSIRRAIRSGTEKEEAHIGQ